DVSALLVTATLTTLSRFPKASYCLAKTSGLLLLVSRTYTTVNEPPALIATSESCSRNVPAPTWMTGPCRLPPEPNRWATTLVSPPGRIWVQLTTKLPFASIATAGAISSRVLRLTAISGPTGLPAALNNWARMSWSVREKVSVQTTTDEPLAELAVSGVNWSLRVVVFTARTISPPSESSCRPSRLSSAGRLRRAPRVRFRAAFLAALAPSHIVKNRRIIEVISLSVRRPVPGALERPSHLPERTPP